MWIYKQHIFAVKNEQYNILCYGRSYLLFEDFLVFIQNFI